LPQTQKHVHNIRKNKSANKLKKGMKQTMPHVYKMSKHQKNKGYKEEEKDSKKKRLENEMHIKCPEKAR
jgi:hypothetical protein